MNVEELCKKHDIPTSYLFDIPSGWVDLLDEMLIELYSVQSWSTSQIFQIKEKLGQLRFYFEILDESEKDFLKINSIVQKFETKSKFTCMTCGKDGASYKKQNNIYIFCPDHKENNNNQNVKT
jgi:uncharacterized UBP type Zn finger protein